MRGDMFKILQDALRARGMTYADLGAAMDLSEPTIKRIFATRDVKLSRLIQICDVLCVPLADVTEAAGRERPTASRLPAATEAGLARDPMLFYFYILLRDLRAQDYIARIFGLTDDQVFRIGMALERLGLAQVESGGRIQLLSHAPVQFRHDGPLMPLLKQVNLRFIAHTISAPPDETNLFFTVSRRMRPETAKLIRKDIEELTRKIAELARQDQLMTPEEDLQTYKVSGTWAAVDFAALFPRPEPEKPPLETLSLTR